MAEPFGPEGLPLELARERILKALQPLGLVEQLPLAAWIAATRATASTSPLGARPSSTRARVAASMLMNPSAVAWRAVAGRSPTSTMCTSPAALR